MRSSRIFILWLLLIMAGSLALTGCGGGSSNKGPGGSDTFGNIFFEATKNTGPNFTPDRSGVTSKSAQFTAADWNKGSAPYQIFLMFRDYDPSLDINFAVGLENLYKVMYQTGQFYNVCRQQGKDVNSIAMTSPYDLGWNDGVHNVYDRILIQETSTRANYFASRKDGSINYGLLCWYIDYGASNKNGKEHGILQGSFDESSGDLKIDLICFVNYPDGNYSIRTHLEGNSQTHYFKLLSGEWNSGSGYKAWYLGNGYSKVTGKKFVIKTSSNVQITNRYYVFDSNATEADARGLDEAGYAYESVPADAQVYRDAIDSMTPFDAISNTPSDIPYETSSFIGSGMGNMEPTQMLGL